jgi:GTP-binding protein EngB required for normal cell division
MGEQQSTALTDPQQRRLITTCQYLDHLLADIERSFDEARGNSPFRRYVADLAPAEQRFFGNYAGRLRTQLMRTLGDQGLSPTPRAIGLRHSILTSLTFFDIAVTELEPRYMSSYGDLEPAAAASLSGITEELHSTVKQLKAYLATDPMQDMEERLRHVAPSNLAKLMAVKRVIEKYGLLEFRGAFCAALATLERHRLEIAVFGRVSTGKSSLINCLLGTAALPVGVNPITAIPTRIRYGATPHLLVTCTGMAPQELDISHLADYASERHNPGNEKCVLQLLIELPAPLLESGVTLVDTPGLGSLASVGATDTISCLPYCDVAVVLLDGSASIAADDVRTIDVLLRAGVKLLVLLGKADLLNEEDRSSSLAYVEDVLRHEFKLSISVSAISTKPEHEELFERWRNDVLVPLIARQDEEWRRSAVMKTALLMSQIEVALRGRLATPVTPKFAATVHEAQNILQEASGMISQLESRIIARVQSLALSTPVAFKRMVTLMREGFEGGVALSRAVQEIVDADASYIITALQKLSNKLERTLRQVAAQAQWVHSADLVVARAFREVPVFEWLLPDDATLTSAPRPANWLKRKILHRRLKREETPRVTAALQNYSAALRYWALSQLQVVREQWAANSDALRAELDRRLGHVSGEEIDRTEVEADLINLVPKAAVSAMRAE